MPWGNRTKKQPAPQTEAVLAAYRKCPNGSSQQIAAIAGVRHEYVRVVLQRNGLQLATRKVPSPKRTTSVRKYRRLQDWEREAVAQAYLDGEKLEAVAVEFGVDQSTVSRVAKGRGYPRRTGPTVVERQAKQIKGEDFKSFRKRLAAQRKRNVEARASA
jgi:hypothetical protein